MTIDNPVTQPVTDSTVGTEPARTSVIDRLKPFLTDSFYRNSLMLMVNTAAATVLGSIFWLVAVRRFAPAEIGLLSSTISASVLLGTASCLGLPNTLIRFIQQRTDTRALVITATTVTALCSAVIALVMLPSSWALPLAQNGTAAGISLAVATVVLTAVSTTLDSVAVGLRSSHLLVAKNVPGGIVKVVALFLVPQVGVIDLAVANLAGMVVSTVIAVIMLGPRLTGSGTFKPSVLQGIWSFSLGNHAGMIFGILPSTVTPLIVLHALGAEEAAFFGVIMQLTGLLNVVPATMSQSLFAELSALTASPAERRRAILKAVRALYAILIPATVFTLLAGNLLLRFFGRQYEGAGTEALRWMALGALVAGMNYLVDVAVNSLGRAWSFLFLNATNAALVLALCGYAATRDGGSLVGVGQGWLIAQSASVAVGLVTYRVVTRVNSNGGRLSGRLGFLDGLRGVAASFVVLSHAWSTVFPGAQESLSGLKLLTAWMGLGYYAVAVFIVISGFSLGLILWRNEGHWPGGVRSFVRRRFMRIVPTYWAAMALGAGLGATLLAVPAGTLWDGSIPIRPEGVLSHALLLQDLWWAGPAGSTAFWSLAIEWHIYLVLFPLTVLSLRYRRGPATVTGVVLALALVSLLPGTGPLENIHLNFYLLFLLGLASARAATGTETPVQRLHRELGLLAVTLVGLAAAATATLLTTPDPLSPVHTLWVGPPVALLLGRLAEGSFAPLRRLLENRVLLYLGAISYSLYLTHTVVIEIVWRAVVSPLDLPEGPALALEIGLGLAASIGFAALFFRLVESRFLRSRPRSKVVPKQPVPA